jgi:hypothetical protein
LGLSKKNVLLGPKMKVNSGIMASSTHDDYGRDRLGISSPKKKN